MYSYVSHKYCTYTHTQTEREEEGNKVHPTCLCLLCFPSSSRVDCKTWAIKTFSPAHRLLSRDWQLADPPRRSLYMDRSATRARASESGVETGRGGEGKKGARGERIGWDKVARSEREEKGSRGTCGPNRTKTIKEVKTGGYRGAAWCAVCLWLNVIVLHVLSQCGRSGGSCFFSVRQLFVCPCAFAVCNCSERSVLAEHTAVCVCRLCCTFMHEALSLSHTHTGTNTHRNVHTCNAHMQTDADSAKAEMWNDEDR